MTFSRSLISAAGELDDRNANEGENDPRGSVVTAEVRRSVAISRRFGRVRPGDDKRAGGMGASWKVCPWDSVGQLGHIGCGGAIRSLFASARCQSSVVVRSPRSFVDTRAAHGQRNTVTSPNAISATAPIIRSRSRTTPPGGERDMVAPFMMRALSSDLPHPPSPTHSRRLHSASTQSLGKGRVVAPRGRGQTDGSAHSPRRRGHETLMSGTHRVMAYAL